MPGPSGEGTANSVEPRRQLQAAAEEEEGDADHPAGKARRLLAGGRGAWRPPDVLPGTADRTPTRQVVSAPLDGPIAIQQNNSVLT